MDGILRRQIAASILSQDQLVFDYRRDNNEVVVRFATPIELEADSVLCMQHLPEEDFRRFKLANIQKFHRVITRSVKISLDIPKDDIKAE